MEEDIDIEEHDVMDNPAVKIVFPDLSIVKSEILDYGIEDPTLLQDEISKSTSVTADSTSDNITASSLDVLKLELTEVSSTQTEDVKPSISSIDITESHNPNAADQCTNNDFIGNRIILGTKRTPIEELKRSLEITRKYREMDKCLSVKLVLKDWGIYLWKSKTYCLECKILFPTLNDFDAHKAKVHETVVKRESPEVETVATVSGIKKYECELCGITVTLKHKLKRHYKLLHKLDVPLSKLIANEVPLSALNQAVVHDSVSKYIASSLNQTVVTESIQKYMAAQGKTKPNKLAKPVTVTNDENLSCSHCNDTFVDKEALISHLYEVLGPKSQANEAPEKSKVGNEETNKISKSNNESDGNSKDFDRVDVISKRIRKVSDVPNESDEQFFICDVCSCYFRTLITFEIHARRYHKKIRHVNYLSGPFDMKCRFCDLNFYTTAAYNKHIITIHKLKTNKSATNLTRLETKTSNNDSVSSLKGLAVPESPIKHRCNKTSQAIPKSILYRCNKCEIHFVTYFSANEHTGKCISKLINVYICPHCGKFINNSSRVIHDRQHLYGDDFKVVTLVNENLSQRILNNCPKCCVHFNDDVFEKHFDLCGSTPPDSYYCKLCDILIDRSIARIHDKAHKQLEIKDFIITDYGIIYANEKDSSESKTTKRKSISKDDFDQVAPKISKFTDVSEDKLSDDCVFDDDTEDHAAAENETGYASSEVIQSNDNESLTANDSDTNQTNNSDLKLRYCFTCNCCISYYSERQITPHVNGICADSKTQRFTCDYCGLKMRNSEFKKHNDTHRNNKTLLDFKFYELNSNVLIKPPLPIFHKCRRCKIYCRYQEHRGCREVTDGAFCKLCNVTFTKSTYSIHKMYHKYFEMFDARLQKKADKYILYQCRKCHVMVTSNNVEAHRSAKYDCDSVKDLYKKCRDCGYSIVGKDYKEHVIQHDLDPKFNKTNIQIVSFNEANVAGIDDDDKYQYSDDGRDGKYTYYQCRSCQCCVSTKTNIRYHNCPMLTCRNQCKLCGLRFYSPMITKHYPTHKRYPDLNHNTIKIIRFGKRNADTKPRKIRKDKIAREDIVKDTIKPQYEKLKLPETVPVSEECANLLYQCLNCKLNYYENVAKTHVCVKKIPYRCVICRLTFEIADYEKHILFHSLNNDYSRARIKIIFISKKTEVLESDKNLPPDPVTSNTSIAVNQHLEEEVENVYKCPCGLHYFSKTAAIGHLKLCGKVKISKQNCTKCKLLFAPEVLFNHLITHHGSKNKHYKYNIIDLEDDKRDVLYKCKVCGLLYVDKDIINKHVRLCFQNSQPKKKCQYCSLLFAAKMINEHLSRHHGKLSFQATDFDIITIPNPNLADDEEAMSSVDDTETQNKIKEKISLQQLAKDKEVVGLVSKNSEEFKLKVDLHVYDNTLYKCVKCNLYFMSVRSFKEHVIDRNHRQKERTEICNLCGFTFPSQVFQRHMNVQHKFLKIEPGAFIIKESFENKANRKRAKEEQKKEINVLYKCRECEIYFMLEEFIYSHVKSFHLVWKATKLCKICGLTFSTSSYARHYYLHHEKLNLKLEDLEIREYPFIDDRGKEIPLKDPKAIYTEYDAETLRDIHLNRYTNKLYRCVQCNLNFMTKCALESHTFVQKHRFSTPTVACSNCGLKFFVSSLKKHQEIHHEKMTLQLDDLVAITDLPQMEKLPRKVLDEDIEPKLYKCKACNIHYVTQDRCYRHVAYGHEPIQKGKMYICEVCNLSFLRPTLKTHQTMHHVKKSYSLKEMVIEEYTPLSDHDRINCLGPKIDVYIAADRMGSDNEVLEVISLDNDDDKVIEHDGFKDALDVDSNDMTPRQDELSTEALNTASIQGQHGTNE